MAELPPYREPEEEHGPEPVARNATWRTALVVGIVVVLIALMIGLHLSGVVGPAR